MKEASVLHISDLHFGNGFSDEKWEQIKSLCRLGTIKPDLVIITGDVVNHPFRSQLKEAKKSLVDLKILIETSTQKNNVPFVYVPGNHDTRVFGLFPLYWFNCLTLLLTIPCFLIYEEVQKASSVYWLITAILIALIPIVARYVLFTDNLSDIFGDMFLTKPEVFSCIRIGVIPLDSSKAKSLGAHGRVRDNMIVPLKEIIGVDGNQDIYWIAAVHHHPLPIPADDFAERSMILKNAGTVLKNLVQNGVPLILHGHKHHQHFSRFFLAAGRSGEREISVLSAGTPTHERSPNRPHSFNLISIFENGNARANVYEADGGVAFEDSRTYAISSKDFLPKRNFEHSKKITSAHAKLLVNSISLDAFGNAIWVEEFSELRTENAMTTIPYGFQVSCGRGYISGGNVTTLNGPNAKTHIQYTDTHSVQATVDLNPPLEKSEQKFACRLEYRIQNFCALNSTQYDEMYKGSEDYKANIESMIFSVPEEIALEQFVASIQFPEGVELPRQFWISIKGTKPKSPWQLATDVEIIKMYGCRTVLFIVHGPKLGAEYRVDWNVHEIRDETCGIRSRYLNALIGIGQNSLTDGQVELLKEEIGSMGLAALKALVKDEASAKQFGAIVTLFGYDSENKLLRTVMRMGGKTDNDESFRFGLGLPGLAFKSGLPAAYDKNLNHRYKPIIDKDRLASPEFEQITNETRTSIALPLFCVLPIADFKFQEWSQLPYGVVKITIYGKNAEASLDMSNETARSSLSQAISRMMHDLMEDAILA